jgi:hypothetical protein
MTSSVGFWTDHMLLILENRKYTALIFFCQFCHVNSVAHNHGIMYATQIQKAVKANPQFRLQNWVGTKFLCLIWKKKNLNSRNLKLRQTVVFGWDHNLKCKKTLKWKTSNWDSTVLYNAAYCHNRKANLKGQGEHTSHQDMYNTVSGG